MSARLRAIGAAIALGAGAATVLTVGGARGERPAAASARSISCPAPSLGGALPAEVYLPAGYRSGGPAYPTVYFLHGLPADPQTYRGNGFVAAALAAVHERAIVVAPQGARTVGSDREYLDWSPTANWPRAIAHDLPDCIDRRFHAIAARSGRALIGQSAGGYGALNIGLRNLPTFGAVEAWSGYVAATDPSGHRLLRFPTAARQRAAAIPDDAALRAALARHPALVAFYCGRSDDRFAAVDARLDASLRASGIAHVYRSYAGGHSAALWSAHAPQWLAMALTYLRSGRTVLPDAGV